MDVRLGHRRGRHRRPRATGDRASHAVRRSRASGQARDGVRRRRSHPRRVCDLRPRSRRGVGHRHRRGTGAPRNHGGARRPVEGAGRCRYRVPHRIDDEELYGDVDPQAPRCGQAVARRPGRAVRPRVEGPPLSHDRLATHHRPPPADTLGRVPRGQPVGGSAAFRERGRAVAHAARGHSVLECARRRLRILELRVRHSRPDRVARVRQIV